MNVRDYQLGVNSIYTIPVVKLTVSTDLNLYIKKGFEYTMMNTNEWIWNVAVSRSLYKGKVIARFDAYDILHQLSAHSFSVNAQNRIEAYYNSIPHYIMLSLSYKFVKSPRK